MVLVEQISLNGKAPLSRAGLLLVDGNRWIYPKLDEKPSA
jgi:hypothetical protein